jgi:hypothetical protein
VARAMPLQQYRVIDFDGQLKESRKLKDYGSND